MTAKDLKNALLQEAVQGKLVPQIASEGNARDLLEEIRKERGESLPLAPVRKRSSATPSAGSNAARNARFAPITEDEIPFDIPENWCWCRLGEICNEIKRGKSPKYADKSNFLAFAQKCNVKTGGIDLSLALYLDENSIGRYSEADNLIQDDIVINSTGGGTMGRVGLYETKVPAGIKGVYPDSHVTVIRSIGNINQHYLYYVLKLNQPVLEKNGTGSTNQTELKPAVLADFVIPLPPLSEQKRIVAALEKFIPLIEEYGKKETELKALNEQIGTLTKKAILQEAVQGKIVPQIVAEGNAKDLLEEIKKEKAKVAGKASSTSFASKTRSKEFPPITDDEIPFDIPENWCWCRLGEIVNYKMGKTPPRAESEWWGTKEDTPWISIADMVADGHINKTKEFMSKKAIKEVFNNAVSKAGTLIMSFKLTVGRVSILDIDATHNEAIISIYPYIDNDNITRNYLFKLLPLLSQNGDAKDAIKGRTLNSTSLSNMIIPLPPLAEQKRIVAAIEKMLPLCEKLGE
ncbi:MAG: restriction endonuclease subunit S [Treponema bryantii]|nr:restriction endonuclease subunit S [Treponema bryantii]